MIGGFRVAGADFYEGRSLGLNISPAGHWAVFNDGLTLTTDLCQGHHQHV